MVAKFKISDCVTYKDSGKKRVQRGIVHALVKDKERRIVRYIVWRGHGTYDSKTTDQLSKCRDKELVMKMLRDWLIELRVEQSLGKDWERFAELLMKSTRKYKLTDSELWELDASLKVFKAQNPYNPQIQGIEIY